MVHQSCLPFVAVVACLAVLTPAILAAYSKLKMAFAMESCIRQAETQFKASDKSNTQFCDRNSDIYSTILKCLATSTKADGGEPASKPEDTKTALQTVMSKVCPGSPGALPTAGLEIIEKPPTPDTGKQTVKDKDQKFTELPEWTWPTYAASFIKGLPEEIPGYTHSDQHNSTMCCMQRQEEGYCISVLAIAKNAKGVEELLWVGFPGTLDVEVNTFARLKETKADVPFMSSVLNSGKTAKSGLQFYTTELWGKNLYTRFSNGQLKPRNFVRIIKTMLDIVQRMHNGGLAHGQLELWNLAVNSKKPKNMYVYGIGRGVTVTRDNAGSYICIEDYHTILKTVTMFGEKKRDTTVVAPGEVPQADNSIPAYEVGVGDFVTEERYNPITHKFFGDLPPEQQGRYTGFKKELPENRFKQARLFTYLDQVHYGVEEGLQLDKFDPKNEECLYTEADAQKRKEAGVACPADDNKPFAALPGKRKTPPSEAAPTSQKHA